MSTFNVSLVNLPKKIELALVALIQSKRLGSFQRLATSSLAMHFASSFAGTNLLIAYQAQLTATSLAKLNAPNHIPVILITDNCDHEMKAVALANNINLLIAEHNSELTERVFDFISQVKIHQQHHALVIDHADGSNSLIAELIRNDFIPVSIEYNPDSVIERIGQNEQISVLVLAEQLTDISGCELMAVIKQHFTERSFIFIGLTEHRDSAVQFLAQGADHALLTPIDGELFTLTLAKLVVNFHQARQQKNSLTNYRNVINKISHDIRNPIYVLMNLNDLFIENQVRSSSLALIEKLSQTAKENISHIFEDLLGYIEVMLYQQPQHLKSCSLNSMIASQLFLESHQAKLKNIVLSQRYEVEANILCVPSQIELVVSNLTNNAVKYSTKNSEVDIRLYQEQNDFIFEVEDSSPPIAKEVYQHVFQRCQYRQHDKELDAQALGLTFCKDIIEAHGGVIGVRSGERGNIFYFKIPCEQQQIMPLNTLH